VALVPCEVVALIRFNGALPLTLPFIGQRRIAQPPAPAIAGADMYPHLPGNATGRPGETPEKGRDDPVRERLLALGEERLG
jgi:hypothetical protein